MNEGGRKNGQGDANGGRSSATPRLVSGPRATRGAGSQSSPLQRPVRKTPAHFPPIETGFKSTIIFLTLCTHQRAPILVAPAAMRLILNAWQAATFWTVGRYVIMPDHVHLFCAPNTFPAEPLNKWIAFWKNHVTRAWPDRKQVPIWQREYWDRQLRRAESYAEKWEYVRNNPLRHGFVARADDWPYQGELNVLEWHDQ